MSIELIIGDTQGAEVLIKSVFAGEDAALCPFKESFRYALTSTLLIQRWIELFCHLSQTSIYVFFIIYRYRRLRIQVHTCIIFDAPS